MRFKNLLKAAEEQGKNPKKLNRSIQKHYQWLAEMGQFDEFIDTHKTIGVKVEIPDSINQKIFKMQ